ncbi:MAG: SGNH/GDSL hydrolase family protein [Proteobacteria bacterium]|nr:SGNH/GDSL hydrolase family protein [Pseudomonadota bacterium]
MLMKVAPWLSLGRCLAWLLLCGSVSLIAQPAAKVPPVPTGALRLTLPPVVYAVPGVPMNLHFANVVLAAPEAAPAFTIECGVGKSVSNCWTLTATGTQVGRHPLTLRASLGTGAVFERAQTEVRIVPSEAGKGQDIALLIVGDSLTHASAYPNEMARLLALPGNPKWRMLGTHHPASAATNVAHEGYGGWTWNRFNTLFNPERPMPGYTNSSPFVAATGPQGKPQLDVANYIAKHCGGRAPDFVTFLLGINDCFRLKADDPVALDAGITQMLQQADLLLAAFHQATPKAELAIGLTTPGNIRDAAFVANYKNQYTRANWRAVQHRLVERQLAHFAGREAEGIFIVPTELNLDIVAGYPDNNAVHPNATGYQQIGASFYSWLKWRLAERDRAKAGQ